MLCLCVFFISVCVGVCVSVYVAFVYCVSRLMCLMDLVVVFVFVF